jgi:hypothetical protein
MLPNLRGLGRHTLRGRKIDVVKTDVRLLEEASLIPLWDVVVPVGRHAPQFSLSMSPKFAILMPRFGYD